MRTPTMKENAPHDGIRLNEDANKKAPKTTDAQQ